MIGFTDIVKSLKAATMNWTWNSSYTTAGNLTAVKTSPKQSRPNLMRLDSTGETTNDKETPLIMGKQANNQVNLSPKTRLSGCYRTMENKHHVKFSPVSHLGKNFTNTLLYPQTHMTKADYQMPGVQPSILGTIMDNFDRFNVSALPVMNFNMCEPPVSTMRISEPVKCDMTVTQANPTEDLEVLSQHVTQMKISSETTSDDKSIEVPGCSPGDLDPSSQPFEISSEVTNDASRSNYNLAQDVDDNQIKSDSFSGSFTDTFGAISCEDAQNNVMHSKPVQHDDSASEKSLHAAAPCNQMDQCELISVCDPDRELSSIDSGIDVDISESHQANSQSKCNMQRRPSPPVVKPITTACLTPNVPLPKKKKRRPSSKKRKRRQNQCSEGRAAVVSIVCENNQKPRSKKQKVTNINVSLTPSAKDNDNDNTRFSFSVHLGCGSVPQEKTEPESESSVYNFQTKVSFSVSPVDSDEEVIWSDEEEELDCDESSMDLLNSLCSGGPFSPFKLGGPCLVACASTTIIKSTSAPELHQSSTIERINNMWNQTYCESHHQAEKKSPKKVSSS